VALVGSGKGVYELWPHLVAADADARPDRGHQILGPRPELRSKRADGSPGGAGACAAPAGVHGRYRTRRAIGEQDRHAVGRAHRDRRLGGVGHEDVGLGPIAGRRMFAGPHHHMRPTVHLIHLHEA
jgi:hypothetical protein